MFKNYLKIALRNIIRQKGYSFINLFGLVIGITACLLISLWAFDELSYDQFHANGDDLYMMVQTQYYQSGPFSVRAMPGPLKDKLLEYFPEVEAATRYGYASAIVANGDNSFREILKPVDNSFFQMFSFPIAYGDTQNMLTEPYSIVLTPKMAQKYFGEDNPVGKTLTINDRFEFTVTAITEECPLNSSIQFDFLVPFEFLRELGENIDSWSNNHNTFIQLHSNVNQQEFDEKVKHFFRELYGSDTETILYTFPFNKIHLYSATGGTDKISSVYLIGIIAILILMIACINYMNLSTARSARRAREVGLRKVVGANRSQLRRQFLFESFLLSIISLIVALVLAEILLPYYNNFVKKELHLTLNTFTILFSLGIVIITGLVAGSYPSFLLSSLKPAKVLKSSLASAKGGVLSRKILVIVQFTLSIILIVCTITIFNQLRYMQNKKLGLNKEDVIYFQSNDVMKEKFDVLHAELTNHPDILSMCGTTTLPTGIWSNGSGWNWEGKDPDFKPLVSSCQATRNYAKTLDITMLDGREFNYNSDRNDRAFKEIIINKTFADMMNLVDPVGRKIDYFSNELEIVGVIDDFHFKPLSYKIEPLVFYNGSQGSNYYLVRYNGSKQQDVIKYIKDTCKEISPGYPVNISFLDERYDKIYKDEKHLGALFNLFTSLALFISCLGLFGLASYLTERRTKEVGVRKVLGSSVPNLVFLLTRDFIKWVLIANVVAWPIAWYAMNKWLQGYAYHVTLHFSLFILTGFLTFLIAFLTVGYQTIKAANVNPVDSIKYE